MASPLVLAGLMAAAVAAQAEFSAQNFEYVGCVEADSEAFGLNIDFFQAFSAEECQNACGGKANYAALGGGCHCDVPDADGDVSFTLVDEAACSVACIPENPAAGQCGGTPADVDSGLQIFNLYKKIAGGEGEPMDDCSEDHAPIENKIAPLVVETIFSCPPEKGDCHHNAPPPQTKIVLPCPPEGCHEPEPTPEPTPCPPGGCPPVYNKLPVACPPECAPCPLEGCPPCDGPDCLPPCPEGCVAPPPAPAPTPIPAPPTTLTPAPCPPGGCTASSISPIAPPPEPPVPAPEPKVTEGVVSQGMQQRAAGVGFFTMAIAVVVVAVF